MNYPRAFQMTVSFAVLAVLSFAQTPTKKISPAQPKSDTWQRSKECAAQAEKAVEERNSRSVAYGGHGSDSWTNHYSPKYNRCFVKVEYFADQTYAVKGGPLFYTFLEDAFERTNVAESADGPSIQLVCGLEENPKECEKKAASAYESVCEIEDQKTACATVKDFITEHMKN
jgi:hypothetical protein